MEVSSIPAEINNSSATSNNTTTALPQSTATSATTTNTSQLLFSNDNLQSHTQKSPTILTMNDDNNLKTQPIGETNNLPNNNSTRDNNRNESIIINNCYKFNDREDTTCGVSVSDVRQSEKRNTEQVEKIDQEFRRDIELTLDTLLSRIESGYVPIVTATTSQSTIFCSTNEPVTKVALITPVVVEEDAGVTKDIVTLRNLEVTPPPQPSKDLLNDETPTTTATTTPELACASITESSRKRKVERTHSETTEQSDESASGRSKRQRKQTELFQVVSTQTPRSTTKKPKDIIEESSSGRKKSPKKVQSRIPRFQFKQGPERKHLPTKPETKVAERLTTERQRDFQDVICYEKNDYLAIRNEENTFYLCQLTENVRAQRPYVKIRWLDSVDNGKTYFITSHYDKIPQKSIIMPVVLNKQESGGAKGKPIFSIDEQIRDTVMERLKRSLNIPTETFE